MKIKALIWAKGEEAGNAMEIPTRICALSPQSDTFTPRSRKTFKCPTYLNASNPQDCIPSKQCRTHAIINDMVKRERTRKCRYAVGETTVRVQNAVSEGPTSA